VTLPRPYDRVRSGVSNASNCSHPTSTAFCVVANINESPVQFVAWIGVPDATGYRFADGPYDPLSTHCGEQFQLLRHRVLLQRCRVI
jgi:hypothetical protein